MTPVTFRDAIMILDVRDLEVALRYCEQLGFALDFRNEQAPHNYAGIRRGDVLLHMQWQSADAFRDELRVTCECGSMSMTRTLCTLSTGLAVCWASGPNLPIPVGEPGSSPFVTLTGTT